MRNKGPSAMVRAVAGELQVGRSMTHDPGRRALLSRSAAVAALGAAGFEGGRAHAAALPVPESNRAMGRGMPGSEYGMPSKFEAHVKRLSTPDYFSPFPPE